MSVELCGLWIEVGGHETVCMLANGHEGKCAPSLHELLHVIRTQAESNAEIGAFILDRMWDMDWRQNRVRAVGGDQ